MSKKKSIIVLFLLFSLFIMVNSCSSSKDQETEELRKELAELKKEKEDQKKSKTEDTEETEEPKTESKTKPQTKPQTKSTFPITDNDVRDLIEDWEQAQSTNDYAAYKSFYAPQFTGIKRTSSGKVSRMNYGQWLNDRRPMLKNIVDVTVSNLNITIDGKTATAEFTQDFKSVNYQDTGQKILKIQMFSDGAKIIFEEMKSSN